MTSPCIELEGVSVLHGQGAAAVRALDEVSLAIAPREWVSVMGPSGAGKSTLLGVMAGLDDPSSGCVRMGGRDLADLRDAERSRLRLERIGFVFQSFHLLPGLSVWENVAWPLRLAGASQGDEQQRVGELLGILGLEARKRHHPSELSGGEQQRAAIARALVNSPDILLADEPTGSLDSQNGARVMDLLEQVQAERSVALVVVTHDSAVAARSHRTIELRDGRLANG